MRLKKPSSQDFLLWVCDQLALGGFEITAKAMFGGYGLYYQSVFFGLIAQNALYFKTNSQTQRHYEAAGMAYFQPNPKQALKRYFQVPVSVLEDPEILAKWASQAYQVAQNR